jgi:hypothetical protein
MFDKKNDFRSKFRIRRRNSKMHRTSKKPLEVTVKEKMNSVLNKNTDSNCLKLIRDIHCGMNGVIL